ncbi:MAG: sodium/proton-translocating pyrophosphatase [Candidatus Melainabacteria bacterium]|nr:MAG: sodium/proton-translocating pyrophosphatase [Candidatus Melainabacteria bacterium]
MHFILPTLVQFVANGFAWDDEDQIKAAILGSFTSIAVVGQILSAGVALAMKAYGAVTDNENLKDIDIFESLDINIFGQ